VNQTRRLRVNRRYLGEWLDRFRGGGPRQPDGVEWSPGEDDLMLRVPLPGLRAREISVEIAEDHVLIRASAVRRGRPDGRGELRAEQDLHLLLPFSEAIEPDRAHAALRSGVLTIRAPRAHDRGPRRVPVKS